MYHRLIRFHSRLFSWRLVCTEEYVAIFLALLIFVAPASAAMRFQERSLYMNNATPGAVSSYTVAFRYMSPVAVGSVYMKFCINPIPYEACVTPAGLDVSNATLSEQSGETGYSILSKTANEIKLSRPTSMITSSGDPSSYKLDNIKNPTDATQSFSVRLQSFASVDATGSQIDFGSVKGQVTSDILIETQVPPMLVFCVAEIVNDNCAGTNDNNYTDMGQLSAQSTLLAQSEMAVGTNASGGFAITANGTPMAAGTNVISSLSVPTESKQGVDQFGINLVANDSLDVGSDPEGEWANAIASPDYSLPNRFKYVPGDVVAYSPNVSLMKKFTVSYIVNSNPNLRAGVYSTTITYIASGRF